MRIGRIGLRAVYDYGHCALNCVVPGYMSFTCLTFLNFASESLGG